MIVKDEDDFDRLRVHIKKYRRKYPMFSKDVERLQSTVENHIKLYSQYMFQHRSTKSQKYVDKAELEIEKINNLVKTIERIELLMHLSK